VRRQLEAVFEAVGVAALADAVIAYEPVWAIGTGEAATPDDAQAAAALIRGILREADAAGADEVPILYGGSCTADSAPHLFREPDVDGALVGGASLNAAGFAAIVRTVAELRT
jgi:triosephosphate isomerase